MSTPIPAPSLIPPANSHPSMCPHGDLKTLAKAFLTDPETRKCWIQRIIHRKDSKTAEHEFLEIHVTICSDEDSRTRQATLLVERGVPPNTPWSKALSASSGVDVQACDAMMVIGTDTTGVLFAGRRSDCAEVATYTWEPRGLPLSAFCTLVQCIEEPICNLYKENCYWLCYVILESLVGIATGYRRTESDMFKKAGSLKGMARNLHGVEDYVKNVVEKYRVSGSQEMSSADPRLQELAHDENRAVKDENSALRRQVAELQAALSGGSA